MATVVMNWNERGGLQCFVDGQRTSLDDAMKVRDIPPAEPNIAVKVHDTTRFFVTLSSIERLLGMYGEEVESQVARFEGEGGRAA